MQRLVFVLEQTLGHVAHSRNIVRALGGRPDIEATVIRIAYPPVRRTDRLPVLRNWSVRASRQARSALLERLSQGPADAVFIHTQVASLLAAGVMRRVPTVVSLDATPVNFDSQAAAYGHRTQPYVVESVKRSINRRTLREAAALVTWCDWAKESLLTHYGMASHLIHTIHPGVDLDLFKPDPPAEATGPLRLLFVGGDFERKGGPDLLAALARLGPAVEADIVTPNPPAAPAGARFTHHGGLQPQSAALLDLYRRADVFVLPARGDCFPQAIAEGMASGLPVISTRVGAIAEMVREGENGLLVPPGSPDALFAAIKALAGDAAMRRRMGAAGRAIAVDEHDAIRNANSIFDLLVGVSRPQPSPVPKLDQ